MMRVCQVRHILGNVNAIPNLDQCIDPRTNQRYTFGCSAELCSRMAKKTSRSCSLIGESMFFAEIERTRRQGFDSFVFSHESEEPRP
jgi:hypothetical protein